MIPKKIIEVTDEISSVLDQIGDAALKHGGIAIFNAVRKLSDAVKNVPSEPAQSVSPSPLAAKLAVPAPSVPPAPQPNPPAIALAAVAAPQQNAPTASK